MEREGRLVRKDAGSLGPEPHNGELLMLTRREVDEPVDPATYARNAAAADVLEKELRRVPGGSRLLRREVAILGARQLVKAVPIGMPRGPRSHAQIVTVGLVLCNVVDALVGASATRQNRLQEGPRLGYDCTLHLVDEELLKKEFVPRLLAEAPPRSFLDRLAGRRSTWPPTSFDKRRRDAPQLWDQARRALKAGDPSSAARQICELALLFSSCELPFESARGIALSLWPLEPAPFNPDLPPGLLGSPEEVLGDLVTAHPDLEGEFQDFFDGNGSPGAYIPAKRVTSAVKWVEAWLDTLDKGQRRHYTGLHRVLKVAAQKGYGYWEATDLEVERIDSDLLAITPDRQTPTLQVQKHVLSFPAYIGAGRSGTLIAVSDQKGARTALFDLNVWPPRERARTGQYVLSASQAVDGRWAMVSAPGGQKRFAFDVRVYDRDLNSPRSLEAELDGKRIELRTSAWSGDRAIGLTERNAFIESGDRLVRITSLPSAAPSKPGSVFHAGIGAARLATGADILIWDGHGYERNGEAFIRTFTLDADGNHGDWTSVPAGKTGFYFLSGRRLYETHHGGIPKRRAAFLTNIMEISEGPTGTLLLKQGDNPEGDIGKIYLIADDSFISVAPELVGESAEFLHQFNSLYWSESCDSILVRLGSILWTIPWARLRDRVQQPKRPPADRVQLLIDGPPTWEKLGDCYHDAVEERLLHYWKSQPATPYASGSVRFSFDVAADGALGDSAIVDGTGVPAEAAILAALRQSAPFRALPEGTSSLRLAATLTLNAVPSVVVPKVPNSVLPKPPKRKPLGPKQRAKAMKHILPAGPESLAELRYLFRGVAASGGTLSSVDD